MKRIGDVALGTKATPQTLNIGDVADLNRSNFFFFFSKTSKDEGAACGSGGVGEDDAHPHVAPSDLKVGASWPHTLKLARVCIPHRALRQTFISPAASRRLSHIKSKKAPVARRHSSKQAENIKQQL